jgi:hypothetical protein
MIHQPSRATALSLAVYALVLSSFVTLPPVSAGSRPEQSAREARLVAARAAVEAAEARLERARLLLRDRYVAPAQVDVASADLAAAKVALAQAEVESHGGSRRSADRPRTRGELVQARLDLARQQYEAILERAKLGRESDPEGLCLWSRRWMEAEQDLAKRKSDRIAAAEAHVGRIPGPVQSRRHGLVGARRAGVPLPGSRATPPGAEASLADVRFRLFTVEPRTSNRVALGRG